MLKEICQLDDNQQLKKDIVIPTLLKTGIHTKIPTLNCPNYKQRNKFNRVHKRYFIEPKCLKKILKTTIEFTESVHAHAIILLKSLNTDQWKTNCT